MSEFMNAPHIPAGYTAGSFVDNPRAPREKENFPAGSQVINVELAPGHKPVRIGYFPGRCFVRSYNTPTYTTNPRRREIRDHFIFFNKKGTRLKKNVIKLIPTEDVAARFAESGLAGLVEGEQTLLVQWKACQPLYEEFIDFGAGDGKAYVPAYILLDHYWKQYGPERTKIPDTMTLNHIKEKGNMSKGKKMIWLHELCATRWVVHNDAHNNPDGIFEPNLEAIVRAANDIETEIQQQEQESVNNFNRELTLEDAGGNEEMLKVMKENQRLKQERAALVATANSKGPTIDRTLTALEQETIDALKKTKQISEPKIDVTDKLPHEGKQQLPQNQQPLTEKQLLAEVQTKKN